MNSRRLILALITFMVLAFSSIWAQSCTEIAAAARMGRAKSITSLREASKEAGKTYRARLIFAYRSFQLRRTKQAADRLLSLLPEDEAQQKVVLTLGDSFCDEESTGDMEALAQVNEALGREFAKAVLLSPRFLPLYVRYSVMAIADPHSDFAVQMRGVCQQAHTEFVDAVKQLPGDQQLLFSKHVMNPSSCTVLAVPEAER